MIKNKYSYIFLTAVLTAGFLFLAGVTNVFASPEITEIMYDLSGTDTDREWIEIYNPDTSDVDITKLKLFEASTNHGINISSGQSMLGPLNYAIIADVPLKFMTDNPNYTGILFDSTFSLSNTGELLELRDASSSVLDSITYDSLVGAGGDDNSLQKINGIWKATAPTPGIENIYAPGTTTPPINTSTTTPTPTNTPNQTTRTVVRTIYVSTHSGEEDLSDYNQSQEFETSAGRQRTVYVGVPIEFKANSKIPKGMESNSRIFKWSFGDGFEVSGERVVHTYKHQGEYNLVLNAELGNERSVSRTIVNVLSPNISLMILPDNSIEISNKGNIEFNLGFWKLKDVSNEFVFANDTIINSGKKIILSPEDIKIPTLNNRISLNNPSGREVFVIDNKSQNLSEATRDQSITVEGAEAMIIEYRKSLALRSEQANNPDNYSNIINPTNPTENSSETGPDLSQTATVLETLSSTTSASLLVRIWHGSVSGIKSFTRLFYDF